jgi:hypothetical protein
MMKRIQGASSTAYPAPSSGHYLSVETAGQLRQAIEMARIIRSLPNGADWRFLDELTRAEGVNANEQ